MSESFYFGSGVIQGGILSPLLFILVMDYVMKKVVNETRVGIVWKENGKISDLDYADDIVLFGESPRELQRIIDCLVREGRRVGLVINQEKTEIINININDPYDCTIENTQIKQVDKFKYLGTIRAKDGSLNLEYKERLLKANQVMGMLQIIWNSNNFSVHTKIRIYTVMVRSILIYGHESWYSTVATDNKFLAFENKALKRTFGFKWLDRITKAKIREITMVQPVDE